VTSYSVEDPAKVQGRDEVRRGQRNLGSLRLERVLDALSEVHGPVLLLGCGAGRYARALRHYLPENAVIGGDLSRTALYEARTAGGGPHYLALDAQSLPFKEAAFGAVVFLDLLEHVPDPDRMLQECKRILIPDGVLHFFVPLEDEPGTLYRLSRNDRLIPIHRWKRDHVGHIQRFSRGDVLRRVWAAGLLVSETDYSFHLVGQIHDIVDYWHRERTSGSSGLLSEKWVSRVTRVVFVITWRLSYVEDRIHRGPRFASGLHVTARRPAEGH
jgi:SAM-dependent methyltransferase